MVKNIFKSKNVTQKKIAHTYIMWILPILLCLLVGLGAGIFHLNKISQTKSNKEFNVKVLDQANKTLKTWIDDQMSTLLIIAKDPRTIEACLNPANEEAVAKANELLLSIADQNKYYENIALASNLSPETSLNITSVDGKEHIIQRGTFFVDSSNGASVGKSSADHPMAKGIYSEGKPHVVTHVYRSLIYGNPVFVISVPVMHEEKLIGTAHMALPMNHFTDIFVNNIKLGDTGYMFMMDENGFLISHPQKENILNEKAVTKYKPLLDKILKGETYTSLNFQGQDKTYTIQKYDFGNDNYLNQWYLVFVQSNMEVIKHSLKFVWIVGAVLLVLLLMITCIIYLITNMIVIKPLNILETELNNLSENGGDLTARIHMKSHDEIGKLGNAVNQFLMNLGTIVGNVSSGFGHVDNFSQQLLLSTQEVKTSMDQVSNVIEDMAITAEQQSTYTNNIMEMIEKVEKQVTQGTQQIEKNTINTKESTELVYKSMTSMKEATIHLDSVHQTVKHATEAIHKLDDHSLQIGNIVTIIKDISEQTNLLALNASIEAARAGEHGQGFAVVADEIRKLAEQSKKSTEEISLLVKDIQKDTKSTVETMNHGMCAVDQQGDIINNCSQALSTVVDKVEISDMNAQQTQNIFYDLLNSMESVLKNTKEIANIIQGYSISTVHSVSDIKKQSSKIHTITENTDELVQLVSKLKKQVGKFNV
ncbi:methyl-accepting chemotaxis protein [Inediibacterium massiliense]|uniref:methyl-accepting chemotaxis protein n=1 Tax=Inediibacterium massiliense TaxID=1658111 RepID=UPI0006B4CB86|nr:methyl-accepting chemotaxis protein [Inediibacterium massiliense]